MIFEDICLAYGTALHQRIAHIEFVENLTCPTTQSKYKRLNSFKPHNRSDCENISLLSDTV